MLFARQGEIVLLRYLPFEDYDTLAPVRVLRDLTVEETVTEFETWAGQASEPAGAEPEGAASFLGRDDEWAFVTWMAEQGMVEQLDFRAVDLAVARSGGRYGVTVTNVGEDAHPHPEAGRR